MTRRLLALLCLLCATTAVAGTARVDGVRVWAAPDHTRLVFDISAPVEHTLFTLESPDRVVIDLEATELAASLQQPDGDGLLRGLRWAPRNGNDLRVVLDLGGRSRPKSFLL
ncbi:MAG TPA: AMIN domain-containing protein, partial [Gammaproteobacteria bacterium]